MPAIKIKEPCASRMARALGVYKHPQALDAVLLEGRTEFLRALNKIDPHYPWPLTETFTDTGLAYSRNPVTLDFLHDQLEYKGEVADLVHPDTFLDEYGGNLTLQFRKRVAHCRVSLTVSIHCPYTEEDRITLRQCGAMREVTENHSRSHTRTIVSCEI